MSCFADWLFFFSLRGGCRGHAPAHDGLESARLLQCTGNGYFRAQLTTHQLHDGL